MAYFSTESPIFCLILRGYLEILEMAWYVVYFCYFTPKMKILYKKLSTMKLFFFHFCMLGKIIWQPWYLYSPGLHPIGNVKNCFGRRLGLLLGRPLWLRLQHRWLVQECSMVNAPGQKMFLRGQMSSGITFQKSAQKQCSVQANRVAM
jgi:hypothetical protein